MAKSSMIGQRNTRIVIKQLVPGINENGFPTETWTAVFASPVWCMWAGMYGQAVYENDRNGETGNATVNMAYSPLVTNRCRIWKDGETEDDAHAYVIVGEPNNLNRKELEFKVRRLVSA